MFVFAVMLIALGIAAGALIPSVSDDIIIVFGDYTIAIMLLLIKLDVDKTSMVSRISHKAHIQQYNVSRSWACR